MYDRGMYAGSAMYDRGIYDRGMNARGMYDRGMYDGATVRRNKIIR